MLLNRENKENRQVVLTIQVEQSAWEKALEDAYEQSKSLFKKEDGSLPTRQEMEEKHGTDVFYQDAVNSTFPVALVEAVRQEDISVAGAPELSVEAIGPEGYVFTALIDLYPEVKLGQYKGLSAPRPQVELSDDDVTAAIDEYLQGHLTEEHPKKAAMGDEVVLDFEGFVNGVPCEGGKAEEYPLLLGSGYFIPGFEEQVAGMATDAEGRFALKAAPGEYTLLIQYLGFDPVKKPVRVEQENHLGDFVMRTSATGIESVEVKARLVRREADRFVVDVANAPAAIGKDGIELLERAPGV